LSDVPKVTFTRLLGFIDILNHIGGKADVAAISSKEQLGLNDILPILETGQMLSLIEVKSGDVSITENGYSLLAASTPTDTHEFKTISKISRSYKTKKYRIYHKTRTNRLLFFL